MKGNQNAEFPPSDLPDFKEVSHGDNALLMTEAQGGNPMDWTLDLLKIREQTDVLQRSGALLRESFAKSLKEPDGQIEPDLAISQEITLPGKKEKKNKEAGLVRAEDIGCLNFRLTTDSLTEEEILLHMFLLTCGRGRCEELVCDHGTFRAANPSCSRNLDESDTSMHFIDFLTPINFPRLKCPAKVTWVQNYL